MLRRRAWWWACVALVAVSLPSWAGAAAAPAPGDTDVGKAAADAAPPTHVLTVGVLPFQSRDEQRAREVTDIVTADLSMESRLRLVERARLDNVLEELGLSKAGVGDAETAQRVGYLAGANVLVWGRLFLIDKQAMLIGRVVGVETGRVFAEQVRGSDTQDLLPMVDELARKLADRILKERAVLVAPDVRDDLQANLSALAESLKGKALPKVAVAINEEHLSGRAFDPAAETELLYWLVQSHVPVFDLASERLQMRQWAKQYYQHTDFEVPKLLPEEVGVLIVGEAVSEAAGTYGPLSATRYRVEVRAVDRVTGDVIAIARRTGTYADVSPVLSGKNGIQRAAAGIAYELLPKLTGYVPKTRPAPAVADPAPPPAAPPTAPEAK